MPGTNDEEYNSSLTPLLERENPIPRYDGVVITTTSEDSGPTTAYDYHKSFDPPLHTDSKPSFDVSSIISTRFEDVGDGLTRLCLVEHPARPVSPLLEPANKWKNLRRAFWMRNRGSVLVVIAMFFGALMSLTTRLLETKDSDGGGMHPFQILFARMGITSILCLIYMLYHNIAPLGIKEIRWLLVLRGISGFGGVLGLYYSLLYLTVADATVICFLAPLVSCLAYSFLLHEPVTSMEKLAGFVSFLGVVVIARPPFLFGAVSNTSTNCGHAGNDSQLANVDCFIDDAATADQVTSEQRMSAIVVGLLGVCGAAVAYISIRWIGSRAHPLVSVNYLSVLSTLVSAICLLCIPGIGFKLPADTLEWAYLLSLGASGWIMQFLITEGLSNDKGGSRATNMVYTQLLFALAFDYMFLGIIPGLSSIVGNILILGSVLCLALYVGDPKVDKSVEARGGEEAGVVEGIDADDEARGP